VQLRAAVMLSLLFASGCSLVPVYHRPATAIPAHWTGSTTRAGVAAHGAWWKAFGSTELDALMEQGLTGNYSLAAAVARIEEARGVAEIDAAPLFPQATLGATRSQTSSFGRTTNQQVLGQASYEIDFWGRNRAAAGSGRSLVTASAFDADTTAMTLSAAIANTYFQYLSLQERGRLAKHVADDARHVLSLIEVQQAAGTATELQVQQQRAAVAGFDAAVPALRLLADQTLHALAVLTGRAPEGFSVSGANLAGLTRPAVAADLPSALLERRPDIRAAEARLVSANFDVGIARAAFYPSVSLSALAGFGARQLSHFFPPTAIAGFGASLLQPLFEGGQLEGQLRYDRARKLELIAVYRQTLTAALQDVEDALSGLQYVGSQEAAETTAEAAARKASALAQLQYRFGSADYLTVLTTEETLYQVQDALLQLHLLSLQAIVGLFRALGGGFGAASGPERL
jgi:NodT family efflux transporter outer membrane factor (OMF) lipoprotein